MVGPLSADDQATFMEVVKRLNGADSSPASAASKPRTIPASATFASSQPFENAAATDVKSNVSSTRSHHQEVTSNAAVASQTATPSIPAKPTAVNPATGPSLRGTAEQLAAARALSYAGGYKKIPPTSSRRIFPSTGGQRASTVHPASSTSAGKSTSGTVAAVSPQVKKTVESAASGSHDHPLQDMTDTRDKSANFVPPHLRARTTGAIESSKTSPENVNPVMIPVGASQVGSTSSSSFDKVVADNLASLKLQSKSPKPVETEAKNESKTPQEVAPEALSAMAKPDFNLSIKMDLNDPAPAKIEPDRSSNASEAGSSGKAASITPVYTTKTKLDLHKYLETLSSFDKATASGHHQSSEAEIETSSPRVEVGETASDTFSAPVPGVSFDQQPNVTQELERLKQLFAQMSAKMVRLAADNFEMFQKLEHIIQKDEARKYCGTEKEPFGVIVKFRGSSKSSAASSDPDSPRYQTTLMVQATSHLYVGDLIRRVRAKAELTPENVRNPRLSFNGTELGHAQRCSEVGLTKDSVVQLSFETDEADDGSSV